MIRSFVEIANSNKEKIAFRYLKNNKVKEITYNTLLKDIYKFCHFFKKQHLLPNDKVIVFIRPSYELYALMLASMMYGINIVVIDSFKNKTKKEEMINSSKAKYVFVNNQTKLLSTIIFKDLKKINITSYQKESSEIFNYEINKENIVLTTFTSGTTGLPKIINRSFNDLENQVKLIKNNFQLNINDTIICMLPIYILFSVFHGNTTCITKKINNQIIDKLKANVILGKISKVLNIKEKITNIQKLYLGGAYIYQEEAASILNSFPNTNIYYIYGASEVVLIGINSLQDFQKTSRFKIAKGITIDIIDKIDKVGEIKAEGLSVKNFHNTADIGYIEDGYLYLLGRKKYSSLENKLYNYEIDQKVREEYNVDKVFTFWYNNKYYIFYQGKEKIKDFIKVKKFPYDLKHNTKVDYSKLIEKYIKE